MENAYTRIQRRLKARLQRNSCSLTYTRTYIFLFFLSPDRIYMQLPLNPAPPTARSLETFRRVGWNGFDTELSCLGVFSYFLFFHCARIRTILMGLREDSLNEFSAASGSTLASFF